MCLISKIGSIVLLCHLNLSDNTVIPNLDEDKIYLLHFKKFLFSKFCAQSFKKTCVFYDLRWKSVVSFFYF